MILPMTMAGSVLSSLGDILASIAKIVSHADSAEVYKFVCYNSFYLIL